jgi:hypothetical protein
MIEDRNARAFIDFLIDHPDEMIDSDDLQREIGFAEHKHVALAAYSIGETGAALGLKRPWTETQRGYLMTAEQADLLRRARQESGQPESR